MPASGILVAPKVKPYVKRNIAKIHLRQRARTFELNNTSCFAKSRMNYLMIADVVFPCPLASVCDDVILKQNTIDNDHTGVKEIWLIKLWNLVFINRCHLQKEWARINMTSKKDKKSTITLPYVSYKLRTKLQMY